MSECSCNILARVPVGWAQGFATVTRTSEWIPFVSEFRNRSKKKKKGGIPKLYEAIGPILKAKQQAEEAQTKQSQDPNVVDAEVKESAEAV